MPLDWSPLVELLRKHDRPLLMTHIRPDADGLGAQLALHETLTGLGKRPRVAIASKLPPRYLFLDPNRQVIEDFRPANFADRDCVVVLDTGTWNQLGDFGDWLKKSPLPRAVVDHHRTQDDLGGLAVGGRGRRIDRAAGLRDHPGARREADARGGEPPVHGRRDRHRLVPAPERDAGDVRARGRAGGRRGEPDAALRAAVRDRPRWRGCG